MDTGVQNPIGLMGGKYLDNGERNKDENFNKSSPNLQNKPDYLTGEQLWSLESKKKQSNNIQENSPINPFYKGSKTFEQNPSQSDINNNNTNNNMAFSSDQIKQLAQENDFQISINNQIRSINFSMNNQNQLMIQIQQQIDKLKMDQNAINNQFQQQKTEHDTVINKFQQQINKLTTEPNNLINQLQLQIYKLTMEKNAMKNQIDQINQMLVQQKQFFETQLKALTSSIQQLIPKNNIINNTNQINNINNSNQIPNFNDDNRNAFNNNNFNSIPTNNNKYIVKFKDKNGTFDVEFKEDESVFSIMRKYRKKSNNLSNKTFAFNGKELDPNLSCKNANLTNNSTINVYDL